jgi:hypothetical protein
MGYDTSRTDLLAEDCVLGLATRVITAHWLDQDENRYMQTDKAITNKD